MLGLNKLFVCNFLCFFFLLGHRSQASINQKSFTHVTALAFNGCKYNVDFDVSTKIVSRNSSKSSKVQFNQFPIYEKVFHVPPTP